MKTREVTVGKFHEIEKQLQLEFHVPEVIGYWISIDTYSKIGIVHEKGHHRH